MKRPARARAMAFAWFLLAIFGALVGRAAAQEFEAAPLVEQDSLDSGIPPMSEYGEGSFFSQDLGTMLRVRYNTRSYGQDHNGNLDIGTFQAVNYADSIVFFDGQVTLNDEQGVGFNTGIGYRWLAMAPYSTGAETVQGVSVWADGTSTGADNFFPQVGVSYESLGELWDLRANGYIPVGDDEQVGDFEPTGEIGFQSNFISQLTEAVVDQSFYTGELELARRLGRERDAWAFAGPYFLANDIEDTIGYEAGVRGYAYPDLLLQFAVSDDEIFATNATFSLVWFVGRTRTNFQPTCGVPDRMREPVMRNDYVVLAQDIATGGVPLTDPDGNNIRVVHVDSDAPDGGDGTFENPLNNIGDINANSQTGDIVLAHALSQFTGQNGAVLKDNQRFLGEGEGFISTVDTEQLGEIEIPETFPGARDATRPLIEDALGLSAITLADNNEVANFDVTGGTSAIIAGPNGAGDPNIVDLEISGTTGDAIFLTPFIRTDTEDIDNDGNITEQTIAFDVTINEITFDSIGGHDINLNAFTNVDPTGPDVTLNEAISITNVTSTNGNGSGIRVANTHDTGTTVITDYSNTGADAANGKLQFIGTGTNVFAGNVTVTQATITGGTGFALDFLNVSDDSAVVVDDLEYDGLTGAAGGLRFDNFDGTFDMRNSDLTNGTSEGVAILNASDGTFDFESTNTLMSVDGTAFLVDGGAADEFTGTVTVAHAISNDTGRSIQVSNLSGGVNEPSVTFNGDLTETGQGMLISSNEGGSILFSGTLLDFDDTTNEAIRLLDNTGTDISFSGRIDIDNTTTAGFVATGGGNLTVSNTNNSITTTTGRIVQITDMTIANAGVNFSEITRTMAANTNAVQLEDNTGGPIVLGTLGDDPGESGMIVGGAADAIVINNSANVTVSGLDIDSAAGFSGVSVTKNTTGTQTVNLNDLDITGGDVGVEVIGNGTGTLNMTVNDTLINSSTATALSFSNIDTGTIQVNDSTIDGNNVAGSAGVLIANSDASFTFNSGTDILNVADTAFEVNNGAGTISMAGDITSTAGDSVHIHDITGGSVTLTGDVTDTGTGVTIANNTGGDISLLGSYDLDTTTSDAVSITGNDDDVDISLADLDINTTTGRGFVATGGGTLTVTGTTNTITTTTGTGVEITDMNIGNAGVSFQSVTVNGAANGIILDNLTGGQVSIGNVGGADGAGGTLNTTGTAITITNVQNVDLRNITITNASGAGADGVAITHDNTATTAMDVTIDNLNVTAANDDGVVVTTNDDSNFVLRLTNSDINNNVEVDATGAGDFALLVENTTIDTPLGTDIGFELDFSGSLDSADVIIRNVDITANDNSALSIESTGGTPKIFDLLIDQGSTFTNDSAADTSLITSTGGTTLNVSIYDNTFTNNNAGGEVFDLIGNGAGSDVRLDLEGNTAAGGMDFILESLAGTDFEVFDLTNTFNGSRNTGAVTPLPNAAAFENRPNPVPLPVIP